MKTWNVSAPWLKHIFILTLLLAVNASSETWYVSKGGSDSNTGKGPGSGVALLTIDVLLDSLVGGDTVYIGAGIWRETIDSIPSGTYGDRTAYIDSGWAASPGTRSAWIYGSEQLTGWDLHSGNVYKHYYTGTVDSLDQIWQGDSLIWRQTSLGAVDAAGEWFYDYSIDSMYIYCVGGGDPDAADSSIEYATRAWANVRGNGTPGSDYVSIYGLGFKYSIDRGMSLDGTANHSGRACDSVFIDHCFLSYSAGDGSANPANIFSGQTDVAGTYNRIRACSLSNVWTMNSATLHPQQTPWGEPICIYTFSHATIDSNVIYGYSSLAGIYFKGGFGNPQQTCNTIAFNTINVSEFDPYSSAIRIYTSMVNTRVYGNTIIGDGGAVNAINILWGRPSDSAGYGSYYNNTIYNTKRFIFHGNGENNNWDTRIRPIYDTVKYNVFFESSDAEIIFDETVPNHGMFLDSNMIYHGGTLAYWHAIEGTDTTVDSSEWVDNVGCDIHSTYSNPGFNNAATGDFSRPSASGEMNRTYGGQTWTVYGAVQTAATTPKIGVTPSQLNFAMVDGDGAPPSQTLQISNAGIGDLNWQVTYTATWLEVSPISGTNTGGVTVSVDPLTAGTYTANITITAISADNSPRVVAVNYNVTAPDNDPPIISFGPDSSMSTAYSNNITWQTNEPATSQVEYGLSAAYGNLSPLDQTLVTAHSVSLTGLTSETVYHFRVISRDASNNEAMSQDSIFQTPNQPDNLALGRPITVSGTYSGYSSNVICDGIIDPYNGTTTTWASDESADHWVEIDLQQAVPVSSVRICWALNGYSSKWMRSQFLTIQGWDGNSWSDLATIDNVVSEVINYPDTVITYDSETGDPNGFFVDWTPPGDDITISAAGFNAITLSRIRILQQGSMGPVSYPSIMWLTEIEIYTDDITPPTSEL